MNAAAPASTRERLLLAAETLFAERGFEATSLRELTTRAGGNLAAIHYHFGSKEALLESIFAARAAPIAERRLELLAACPRNAAGQIAIEDIIEAFMRPGWELDAATDAQTPPFMQLRARISIERKDLMRTMLSRAFDASSRRFIEALGRSLPELPRSELYWRFHFLLGVMNYSMANPGRIQSLSDDACDPGDLREMLPRAVAFVALGFRGPAAVRGTAMDTEDAAFIRIEGLTKVFASLRGERVLALDGMTVDIREGELITVVGPSGCGKSTLLKMLAGLLPPSSGSIRLAGSPVLGTRRDVGMVFQNAILLPWRTILENVMLPAEVLKMDRRAAKGRAETLLGTVGLAGFEGKYPSELSGGMQQRAAICRALLHDPAILLMDEPFGALDAMTREQMNLELQSIWQRSGKTIVLITHSIPEAVFLGDRVFVMTARPGRLAQVVPVGIARPRDLDVMSTPEFGAAARVIRGLLHQRGVLD